MLRSFAAVYERASEYIDHPSITTRLYVRAEGHQDAMRLADQVFEQIYGSTPQRLRFTQVVVRPAWVS